MSKRSIIFSVIFATITATLSVQFIIASLLIDLFANNDILADSFYYIRVAFDLIAEFACYGIILYAYCRYPFKKAWPGLLIAFGSCIFSHNFLIGAEIISEIVSPTSNQEFGSVLVAILSSAFLGILIERILPFMAIVLISYLCTRNGTEKISKLVSFKNPIQRAMLISSLLIYLINAVPALSIVVRDLATLNNLSSSIEKSEGWQTFWTIIGYGALEQLTIVIYNFVLLYAVYMLIYRIIENYSLKTPNSKNIKNNSELVVSQATEPETVMEEK